MIVAYSDLKDIRAKHQDEALVLTSGTFDLFHVGHLHYLQGVKSYGDVVVVLLSGDARVKARKGPTRPVISEADRAEILDALKMVDYIFIDPSKLGPEETDPLHAEIISLLQPDYYVTDGPDPRFVTLLPEPKFKILDRVDGGKHASTSAIIEYITSLPRN
jgi:cytidyltransferase-like protein